MIRNDTILIDRTIRNWQNGGMTENSATGPAGSAQGSWVSCEIPGCSRRIEYAGTGRKPKYCGEVVDGVPHTRLTAYRLGRGQAPAAEGLPAGRAGEVREGVTERPVSVARLTLEALLGQVREVVAGHEVRMASLVEQVSAAAAVATDPDAAVAEVTGAHREARAAIDEAEAERDAEQAAAREAERVAAAALEQRRTAEEAAEDALGEAEAAQEARDQARRDAQQAADAAARAQAELVVAGEERTRTTDRLSAVSTELEQARAQLAQVRGELGQARDTIAATRQEVTDLAVARDALAAEIAAERERTAVQHRRAEDAERETSRAQGSVEQLRGELATAREAGDRQQGEVLRVGTQLATATAQLAAARELVETEKAHAGERVADHRQRTEAAERDAQQLRADLDEQRTRHTVEVADLRRQLAELKPAAEGRPKARGN